MRIVEIKSQNVKIIYRPAVEQLKIGDFVTLTEGDLILVAQVFKIVSSAAADDFNQADLFFVLSHKYGKTYPWQGEVISVDAIAQKASKVFLEQYIKLNASASKIVLGEYLEYAPEKLVANISKFATPAFIGYEKLSDSEGLLKSITKQFCQNGMYSVVIDFYGNSEYSSNSKIMAGFQMKLPLNSKLIDSLCGKILEGVSIESRAVIEDVLFELSQYADECKAGFIPISQLIDVVDAYQKKSRISQLILLKNRLRFYQKLGIFADTEQEVFAVFNELAQSQSVTLDLGRIPLEWRKEFLNSLLELNQKIQKEFYLFFNLDEQNSDNAMINNILFKSVNTGIKPILSVSYRYLSFENLYDFSKNIFLFKTYNALKKRPNVSEILQSLPTNSFILTGHLTNGLIVCAQMTEEANIVETEITTEVVAPQQEEVVSQNIETLPEVEEPVEPIVAPSSLNNSDMTNYVLSKDEELPIKNADIGVLDTAFKPEPSINLISPEDMSSSIMDNIADVSSAQEMLQNEIEQEEIEIVALPKMQVEKESIEEDNEPITQSAPAQIKPTANLFEEDFVEDVETLESFENEIAQNRVVSQEPATEEPVMEDMDLDELDFLNDTPAGANSQNEDDELLDLLNDSDDDLLDQYDAIDDDMLFEEEKPKTPQPQSQKLPVYGAETYKQQETTNTASVAFQEGDLVKHNKYGIGTVRKITSHGDKVLCHINFEDFGRRLLDPEIAQLEKIQ